MIGNANLLGNRRTINRILIILKIYRPYLNEFPDVKLKDNFERTNTLRALAMTESVQTFLRNTELLLVNIRLTKSIS